MFGYRNDFDRTLAIMDQLRRRMDRVFDEDFDSGGAPEPATGGAPRVNFHDTGNAFVLQADVPGVREAQRPGVAIERADDIAPVRRQQAAGGAGAALQR